MDKKYEKSNFDEFGGFNISKEEEIAPKVADEPVIQKATRKYIVEGIMGQDFILIDELGNGHRLPIPAKYKDAKKGDTIYL